MAADDEVEPWYMANIIASVGRGSYQRDIVGDVPYGVVDGTQERDVSQVLDLLALAETPFINRIGWGPESGGTTIEWISEDLGPGFVTNQSAMASNGLSVILNSLDGAQGSALMRQLHEGTILYVFDSTIAQHGMLVVTSEPVVSNALVTVHASILVMDPGSGIMTGLASVAVDSKWYVLGNVQNEGSKPGQGKPRARAVLSNSYTILRQDVAITGSMQKTDMYVIGREDKHQVMMRLKEMQRDREASALYSVQAARTSVIASRMNGVLGFLATQSGDTIDTSTITLTKTALETVVRKIWENGGRNLTVFGSIAQTAKVTQWDENRIRTTVNESLGGGYIEHYLCNCGIEVELVPMANVPVNLLFVLDTSRIRLRAKRSRKAIMEKLGKMGDFDNWQLISEFSMEMGGYNLGQHGMFLKLQG